MDHAQLGRLWGSLRQIALPLVVYLVALQAFQILLMPVV